MKEIAVPTLTLNDGTTLPAIGFGTYKMNGEQGVEGMLSAVDVGYRLLDSAFNYENEGAIGQVVKRTTVPRDELRVVSKLPGRHHAYDQALLTIQESLYRAGLDYYDLYLIHWPNPKTGLYLEAWRALVEAKKRGWLRSIGVCNFLPEHLEKIIADTGVTPSINQIELHPYFPQDAQLAWDKAHGIVTQAWSPLGRASAVLSDKAIGEVAKKHGKTISQVILRWHVQRGTLPLPKASGKTRQIENLAVFDFELTPDDLAVIAKLARPDGRLANQDPAEYEEF